MMLSATCFRALVYFSYYNCNNQHQIERVQKKMTIRFATVGACKDTGLVPGSLHGKVVTNV